MERPSKLHHLVSPLPAGEVRPSQANAPLCLSPSVCLLSVFPPHTPPRAGTYCKLPLLLKLEPSGRLQVWSRSQTAGRCRGAYGTALRQSTRVSLSPSRALEGLSVSRLPVGPFAGGPPSGGCLLCPLPASSLGSEPKLFARHTEMAARWRPTLSPPLLGLLQNPTRFHRILPLSGARCRSSSPFLHLRAASGPLERSRERGGGDRAAISFSLSVCRGLLLSSAGTRRRPHSLPGLPSSTVRSARRTRKPWEGSKAARLDPPARRRRSRAPGRGREAHGRALGRSLPLRPSAPVAGSSSQLGQQVRCNSRRRSFPAC